MKGNQPSVLIEEQRRTFHSSVWQPPPSYDSLIQEF